MHKINPTTTQAWKKLQQHFETVQNVEMKELFKNEGRAADFTLNWADFYIDYSKNRMTAETKDLLLELASEMKLDDAIKDYYGGVAINETEGRAVMHTALRSSDSESIYIEGENVIPEVERVKEKIEVFTKSVIEGAHKGYTGKPIKDVVNIGIGGSDLGPVMVTEALAYYKNHLNVHFISNANTARTWFLSKLGEGSSQGEAVAKHFVAVSSNTTAVVDFGIDAQNIFPMWEWVGGRFSLWSAVGLSIALSIGYNNFKSLLAGAHKMDVHFKETPFEKNMPVMLALVGIWYNNFFKSESEAIIPYTQYLHRFSAYLQQAIMESNGKSVDQNGNTVTYETGSIIWGEPGTNSQHAFFQLIHQGTKLIPTDFIGYKESLHGDEDHHNKLMANFFAQTEALMNGKTLSEARAELEESNLTAEEIDKLAPFKVFQGNKPTNSILIDKLTPESLGALIALYEHKIFTQGILWNIYSYDQWGVELGKQLAKNVLQDIVNEEVTPHDASTTALIKHFKS